MKETHKLSNSFLVYGTVILSIFIYIFGIFSVINFANEVNEIGFLSAFGEHFISITLGVVCLFLVAPSYRLTKSLRILEVTDHENGTSILTVYAPFFMGDMLQADQKIILQNLKTVRTNDYFSRLVELEINGNDSERNIKSFMSPEAVARITST